MTSKKSVVDLLTQARETIMERGANYGDIENNFQLIADIASLRLGRDIHPYEVAVILCCVKNARNFASPNHEDSHIDAANYELFAATFAEDYASRGAGVDVGYRRKPERKQADIGSPSVESLDGVRAIAALKEAASRREAKEKIVIA